MSADGLREAQRRWGARSVEERLKVVRAARYAMAARCEELADAISPRLARTKADTLGAEVMPLLDACKFLEREAERILATRRLGLKGRPVWLSGVWAEVHREPLGHVVVIGPSNFPLLLAGSQTMQALVAGNAVTWKPGAGAGAVAELVASILSEAGLPRGVLRVTGESVAAGEEALSAGADKVVFTGSAASGRAVARRLAEMATPAVMELSGADAVVVLPSADLKRVAKAVAFGLGLNGGEVCMSPRRLFATAATMAKLRPLLMEELVKIPAVKLSARTAGQLQELVSAAMVEGAVVRGEVEAGAQRALVVDGANASMAIACSDVFAPVVSLIEVSSMMHVAEAHAHCAYGLAASVFGEEREARAMAAGLRVGSVTINDIIAPTADARVPFGGRGASGYGVTRGAEGLLEMTAIKVVMVRRGRMMWHLDKTTEADTAMFAEMIRVVHGQTVSGRLGGVWRLIAAVRRRG